MKVTLLIPSELLDNETTPEVVSMLCACEIEKLVKSLYEKAECLEVVPSKAAKEGVVDLGKWKKLPEEGHWSSNPKCPECKEVLSSHAGRDYKFFHQHAFGSYDGSSSGKCSLDGMAFELNGTPIQGSAIARKSLCDGIHERT